MSVTAGVSDAALAARAKLQGGIGQTRVGRYWPGKAPEWAKEDRDDDDDHHHLGMQKKKVDVLDDELERNKDDDPRLRRLGQVRADHRRVRQAAKVISTEEELRKQETIKEEDEDVEALEERRSRIREKNLKRSREEADLLLPLEDEEEEVQGEEEEEESEYETDSEAEMFGINMMKPVFVPKAERDTIAERERMEAEEEALEKLAKKKLEMRKIETKAIVVEEVRKDEERRKNALLEEEEEANLGDVETDDEANEAEEYEAWKTRELSRIKRDKDARGAMLREKEEVDKLRNMTEQERKEWERDNPKASSSAKPKKKWRFMQRYYHKGAYFQEQGCNETDGIFQRDYSAPTGVDRLDKSLLREVMQVKHFGRSGGTKWTHLVKEDTTYGGKNKKDEEDKTKDWSDPWVSNAFLRQKYNKRMAAMDAPIARPRGSKKMKAW